MNDAEPILVTRFTTDAFVPDDRHEAWATRDWPTIGPVFDTQPIEPFHNRSERFALGALTVHVADMGAQRYERTQRRARADGFDHLVAEVTLTGRSAGNFAGADVRNGTGGICLCDLAQAQTHESSDSRTILLSIPRAVAQSSGLDPHPLHGAMIGAREAALLRAHLIAIHAALPDLSVAQGDRLGRTVLDLLAVALGDAGARAPGDGAARDSATLLAARRLIDARLGSATLSVAWLCDRLGVSRSALYRLFDVHGGVQAYIRERRLERVRETLTTANGDLRLGALADTYGFSDASHMSRLFRARYGESPRDHREAFKNRHQKPPRARDWDADSNG